MRFSGSLFLSFFGACTELRSSAAEAIGCRKAAAARLNRALNAALAEPEVRQKLADVGIETRPGTPEDLARFVRAEADKWGEVIRKGNIRAD